MKNRDYRELQLSSSQLVFIFLAILILGVIIFLLGVSVGKKQAQLTDKTELLANSELEQVEEKTSAPIEESKDSIDKELASHQKVKTESLKKTSIPTENNLWYIQVGAFNERERALSFAETFKKEGYRTTVLEPFSSDKKDVFRVRIGGFKSQEEAKEARDGLKSPTRKKTRFFIIKG
jgi:cell division septation protein DedD